MDGQGSPGSSNTKRTCREGRSRNRLLQNNTEALSAYIGMESGKANAQLELYLAREMKDRKKCFSKYIGSKRKTKVNVGSLLSFP